MLKSADIITYLRTNWNTTNAPLPEMLDAEIIPLSIKKYPSLANSVGEASLRQVGTGFGVWIKKTQFMITAVDNNNDNLEKQYREIVRLTARAITGGWWQPLGESPETRDKQHRVTVYCQETLWSLSADI